MSNREPPNLREAECCAFCMHYDDNDKFDANLCRLHRNVPWKMYVCDDYEAEVPSEDQP